MKRVLHFEPGFDCIRFECKNGSKSCKPGTGGSHGRHGLQVRWVVIGDKGAVQFVLMTGWPVEPGDFGNEFRTSTAELYPMPSDLGYHSLVPRYEGQSSMGKCDYLDGRECYYDGSGLNAYAPFALLCNEGDEALWLYLERYYESVFNDGEYPKAEAYKWAARDGAR